MGTFREPFEQALAAINQPGSPFEISRSSEAGNEVLMYCNAPKTLTEILSPARDFGDNEFIHYVGERISFSEFFLQVDRTALLLANELGVKKGHRVAIAMRNYPEWLSSFVAIISIGATAVPLNSFSLPEELQQHIEDSEADILICDQARAQIAEIMEGRISALVVRADEGQLPDHCRRFEEAISNVELDQKKLATLSEQIHDDDLAMIMYTSGTSGKPKGAAFSHFNCCQALINFEACGAIAYMANKETFDRQLAKKLAPKALICVPLFHVSGLFAQFLLNLRHGRGMVMMYKWDPVEASNLIESEKISVVVAAPSMLMELLECPRFHEIDRSSISNISGGGAATPSRFFELVEELIPGTLPGNGWGMTESGASGAAFTGYFAVEKPKSCGFVNPVVELRFCDEDGNEVSSKDPGGEIWLRSPCAIRAYYKNEEATKSSFRDGWFKSGDIGYLDEDDCLVIYSRAKDLVIRGGENIYPVEVEHCIEELDSVKAAAAFAVPSEAFGEELAVVVHCHQADGSIDENTIREHCSARLARFKVPSFIVITDEPLPVNATNKVLKAPLREKHFPATAAPTA